MVIACRLDSSDKDKVDEDTTNFPKDLLEKSPPGEQTDPSHEVSLTSDQPFHYIKDEIDLKPGRDSTHKTRSHPIHEPWITEEPTKRIQLHRRKSSIDPSRADEGPSYGLPGNDPLQSGLFAEIEKDDTGDIDISGLSLNIDLEQITVLRQIFQEKQK